MKSAKVSIRLSGVAIGIALFTHASVAGVGGEYRLVLPLASIAAGEVVEEIRLSVACGHIDAITGIPDLWNLEIQRSKSAEEQLRASAGVGAAAISRTQAGAIEIRLHSQDDTCLRLSGEVVIRGLNYKSLPLSEKYLRRF